MQDNGASSDLTFNVKLLANEKSIFFERADGFTALSWLIFQIKKTTCISTRYINLCYNFENNPTSPEKITQDYSYAFS